ncbi:hypothetical protein N7460_005750 [Penicillium canescens]|uniref:Nephrocystin 3-like N-terminal domain-containing protein n=1 Tax=Penicillium canescens TaxID=5083 RepID=A0AAD6NAV5_PENCN|nr:hypothetical protein N7460_005750 [Penicillium canescens]
MDDIHTLLHLGATKSYGLTCCPLCNSSGSLDAPELIDHVLQHTHDFALRALPWPKHRDHARSLPGTYDSKIPNADLVRSWLDDVIEETTDSIAAQLDLRSWDRATQDPNEECSGFDYFEKNDYFADCSSSASLAALSEQSGMHSCTAAVSGLEEAVHRDGLSSAASVIAVIQLTGNLVKLCGIYIQEVNEARDEILTLQGAILGLQGTLQDLQKLLQSNDGEALPTSSRLVSNITDCVFDLRALQARLDLGNRKKLTREMGLRALTWPLKRTEGEGVAQNLERYQSSFLLSLQVDQREQFEKLLLQPLLNLDQLGRQPQTAVIVIDALDECEHDHDVRNIIRLLPLLQKAKAVRLRIFLTSRPELPISLGFKEIADYEYQDLALHEISEEVIEHDIHLFLLDRFAKIQHDRNISKDWPGDNIIRELVTMSAPLFISAATICRYIENSEWDPKLRLAEFLTDQAKYISRMDKTYLPILTRLLDDQESDESEQQQQQLLQEFQNTGDIEHELADFLHDAYRFVLKNRQIVDVAPLQLYCSCLVFAPKHSIIRRLFCGELPSWISGLPNTEKDWSAELQTLEGHAGSVRSAAFSPDGQLVASGSTDKAIWLWDTIGTLQQTLEGHSGLVQSVAFSPDGRLIASGSTDETVRLWDTATGSLQQTLEGHSSSVNSVAFSPAGRLLASGSADRTVRLWDTVTGVLQQTFEGHSQEVHSVTFSPNGRLIASGSADETVQLWDTATGGLQQTLEAQSSSVNSVAFSPAGRLLVSGSADRTVRLWDTATGVLQQTFEGHSQEVESVAFSPDGQLLASSSTDRTVRVWDTATGALQQTLEGHSHEVHSVTFSPNGQLLASSSTDRTVRLWNTATGVLQQTLKAKGHLHEVNSVAFSPDGQLLASSSADRTLRLWDTATGSITQILGEGCGSIASIAFSTDGRSVITNLGPFDIRSDIQSGHEIPLDIPLNSIDISVSDGQWIKIHGKEALWLPPGYRPTCIATYSNTIALGHASGRVSFISFSSSSDTLM